MTKFQTVDQYIASQPGQTAERLSTIRQLFHEVLSETTESIRYNMPAFTVGNGHLYVSTNKNHIGYMPMYGMPELEKDMQLYRGDGTKDALHFKHSEPLPTNLIKKIIKVKERQ